MARQWHRGASECSHRATCRSLSTAKQIARCVCRFPQTGDPVVRWVLTVEDRQFLRSLRITGDSQEGQ
jgi:hypothetical protein